jgi:hypothetical protein
VCVCRLGAVRLYTGPMFSPYNRFFHSSLFSFLERFSSPPLSLLVHVILLFL